MNYPYYCINLILYRDFFHFNAKIQVYSSPKAMNRNKSRKESDD